MDCGQRPHLPKICAQIDPPRRKGNMAPIRVERWLEPCKSGPQFYTQCVTKHDTHIVGLWPQIEAWPLYGFQLYQSWVWLEAVTALLLRPYRGSPTSVGSISHVWLVCVLATNVRNNGFGGLTGNAQDSSMARWKAQWVLSQEIGWEERLWDHGLFCVG